GLIAPAFFDTRKGPEEFIYVPDDLLALVRSSQDSLPGAAMNESFGHEARAAEKARMIPAKDHLLDDATTFLAALRLGRTPTADAKLSSLLNTAGLLKKLVPQAAPVKTFLEASRPEALKSLRSAWQKSPTFDELRLMPDLVCEGVWKNSPRDTRMALLDLL